MLHISHKVTQIAKPPTKSLSKEKEMYQELSKILKKCQKNEKKDTFFNKFPIMNENKFALSSIKLNRGNYDVIKDSEQKKKKKIYQNSNENLFSFDQKINWKGILKNNDQKKISQNPLSLDLLKKIENDKDEFKGFRKSSIKKRKSIYSPNSEKEKKENFDRLLKIKNKQGLIDCKNNMNENLQNSKKIHFKLYSKMNDLENSLDNSKKIKQRGIHFVPNHNGIIYKNKIIQIVEDYKTDDSQKDNINNSKDLFTTLCKNKVSPTEYFFLRKKNI